MYVCRPYELVIRAFGGVDSAQRQADTITATSGPREVKRI